MILKFVGLSFMRLFAITILLCAVSFLTLAQTTKQKSKAQTTKPKTTATPSKVSTPAKPKPVASPVKKTNEKAVWEKAIVTDPREARIVALQNFSKTFPKSAKRNESLTMIAFLHTDAGNEKLGANDVDGAIADFRLAATEAPKPVPDNLWTEALSKIAANLYFRGARESALEIERILESRADANAKQLLDIANFYMTIENGSEARRVSLKAIALEPNSAAAYQTLGLASRIDFQLFSSASAYERALELDPTSVGAKRGLAEMKRALGKSDEAVTLYRDILATDVNNIPAQTGLVLALFDADKRADAEVELAKSLEVNPSNVILLAGAAYWYAAHNEGAKAAELAQKAIDSDPRFVWSHIALARSLLLQNRAADAEKTLLAARRYGNFPTLEYEIASARASAGYYREAAEGLSSVFKITDGKVSTNLGGRVEREAPNFTELVADERRASIFAPVAAGTLENAASLAALLEFKQQLDAAEIKSDLVAAAADSFTSGSDKMKFYRQIFAASHLLEKKVALTKVLELTRAATSGLESGLDLPNASIATMASELYEARAIAATKGEYIVVPDVPRPTLSAVLRGRLEELAGWANYNLGVADEAVIRLRRAVGVLPANSAWWRSSTWRLGAALALAGKDAEALEMYIKSYKSASPDVIRYGIIEALYRKVNGSTDGLADKIGPNPAPQVSPDAVAQKTEPTPQPSPETSPTPEVKPEPSPTVTPTPADVKVEQTPTPAQSSDATPAPTVEPTATVAPTPEETKPSPTPAPTPESTPVAQDAPTPQPTPDSQTEAKTKELFPPVIITIPAPSASRPATEAVKVEPSPSPTPAVEEPGVEPSPSPEPTPVSTPTSTPLAEDVRPRIVEEKRETAPEIKPCKITVSEEPINLKNTDGRLAVIVGLDDDGDVDAVQATSSSVQDVTILREPIAGLTTRALFVLRSISDRLGVYQVMFQLPCGKRTVTVNVR
jgi:tetratricopeptide (TPR) repeat protein